jgi:hypothetical protein
MSGAVVVVIKKKVGGIAGSKPAGEVALALRPGYSWAKITQNFAARLGVCIPFALLRPAMLPNKLRKGQLPTKICVTCGRPFEYRKKWRANWEEVKYCGEKCQRNKPSAAAAAPVA